MKRVSKKQYSVFVFVLVLAFLILYLPWLLSRAHVQDVEAAQDVQLVASSNNADEKIVVQGDKEIRIPAQRIPKKYSENISRDEKETVKAVLRSRNIFNSNDVISVDDIGNTTINFIDGSTVIIPFDWLFYDASIIVIHVKTNDGTPWSYYDTKTSVYKHVEKDLYLTFDAWKYKECGETKLWTKDGTTALCILSPYIDTWSKDMRMYVKEIVNTHYFKFYNNEGKSFKPENVTATVKDGFINEITLWNFKDPTIPTTVPVMMTVSPESSQFGCLQFSGNERKITTVTSPFPKDYKFRVEGNLIRFTKNNFSTLKTFAYPIDGYVFDKWTDKDGNEIPNYQEFSFTSDHPMFYAHFKKLVNDQSTLYYVNDINVYNSDASVVALSYPENDVKNGSIAINKADDFLVECDELASGFPAQSANYNIIQELADEKVENNLEADNQTAEHDNSALAPQQQNLTDKPTDNNANHSETVNTQTQSQQNLVSDTPQYLSNTLDPQSQNAVPFTIVACIIAVSACIVFACRKIN